MNRVVLHVLAISGAYALPGSGRAQDSVPVDFTGYHKDCGVEIKHDGGNRLDVVWPLTADSKEFGRITLRLKPKKPLIESIGIGAGAREAGVSILKGVDPVTFVTVGPRNAPAARRAARC